MVRKDLGLKSALELKGARVCVVQGTTLELNLHRFSERYGLNIELLAFEDTEATLLAYRDGECDALTNDRSQLAALSPNPPIEGVRLASCSGQRVLL